MAQWDFSVVGRDGVGLCSEFVEALPVTGAAVSVFGASVPETAICASDRLAARLDELQFDLGEGPRWEAARSRMPVLVPYARHGAYPLWPVFATEMLETDAQALFVFPLTIGALDVGVVELYRSTPGALTTNEQAIAAVLANKTAWNLMDQLLRMNQAAQTGSLEDTSPPDSSPLSRREIHQATGMVLVQTGTTATEALLLLRAHAFANGRTVRDVASDVVARRLDFTSHTD
jgi:hypothetical protein